MPIIWCMVPETWSVTDKIFIILDHFLHFQPSNNPKNQILKTWKNAWKYHFTQVYHIWQSYDIWFLRYEAWQTKMFVILDRFWLFCSPNSLKIQNFEKMKNIPGDIISVIWYMAPQIWTATDRLFCQFEPFFGLLTTLQPKNSLFCKNEKNTWRYYHFTQVHHKWQSHDVWFMRYQA